MPSLRAVLLIAVILLSGCRSHPEVRQDLEGPVVYQTIANQLPRADFGWGDPPAIASMAASERGRPEPSPDQDPSKALTCNERRMVVVVEVFRPRAFDVPYDAILDVSYTYCLFPNLPCCFVFPFFQVSEARVVFDARRVDGLIDHIRGECDRLEQIAREVGFSGPWDHAQAVKQKLRDDAAEFGEGSLAVEFSYVAPIPPVIPYTAPARRTAEAFAWARDKAQPKTPNK
jgi:hypothetical protein